MLKVSKRHANLGCELFSKLARKKSISIMSLTRLTLTCSKSTIETLEKGVKFVQS